MATTILPAGPEQIGQVRALFEEYWASFGFTPCFQGFGEELASLPGAYAPPAGRLLLAWEDGVAAGCAAFRPLTGKRCEAKRLYVRPAFRGKGIGRALMEALIGEARASGYQELLGDTMPAMQDALSLYERMGFERTAPYLEQPTEGAICIRYPLASPGI